MSVGCLLNLIRKIVLVHWLWEVFAGFYLATYTFWIPTIFENILAQAFLAALNLIIGLSLLTEGFSRALELEYGMAAVIMPLKRIREASGAILLLGYLLIYSMPRGRLVPHWPLDMVITFLTGVIIFSYAIWNIGRKEDS
jgi:hypothetical protein